MARWIKAAVKGRRWRELAARLGWMGIVALLIYGVQHLPVSMEWKIAIGEGIGIFGGVELILDVIRGLRMEREIEELRRKAYAEERENEELRRRNAESGSHHPGNPRTGKRGTPPPRRRTGVHRQHPQATKRQRRLAANPAGITAARPARRAAFR